MSQTTDYKNYLSQRKDMSNHLIHLLKITYARNWGGANFLTGFEVPLQLIPLA